MSVWGVSRTWQPVGKTLDQKYYFVRRKPSNYSKNRKKLMDGYVRSYMVDRELSYFEVFSADEMQIREREE